MFRVQFSHVSVFSDLRNVQKRATKSDTSDHCLLSIGGVNEIIKLLGVGYEAQWLIQDGGFFYCSNSRA